MTPVDYVVVDTDVVSLVQKDRLPIALANRLIGRALCVSFVTIGELTQWADLRNWGQRSRAGLEAWLNQVVELEYDGQVARTWGHLSAAAVRRGRPRPANDMWIAATCLAHGFPLATLNIKDYVDFADHHGLELIGRERAR